MSKNVIVVSADSHVAPRLREDLRSYCPKRLLTQFDDFVTASNAVVTALDEFYSDQHASTQMNIACGRRGILNAQTIGRYDPHTRLAEMDWDGVAAEVIFHGSGRERIPFSPTAELFATYVDVDLDLLRSGYHLYNQWLADFVSVAPERLIGLMYLPMWDVDLAIEEARWAAAAGIQAVNFPAPRAGIREYDDPAWEPFWTACENLQLTLSTHGGVPLQPSLGPQSLAVCRLEGAGWPVRRGMQRMLFAGVFERHRDLNLILTETNRSWWTPTAAELDHAYGIPTAPLLAQMPKPPSEYMKANIYIGASFMPPIEVQEALDEDYWPNVAWGRDYPHGEGTYKFPESEDEPSTTRQWLRWSFAGCPTNAARAMLGENGIRAYHLDADALAKVASEIGPSVDELSQPLTTLPAGWIGDIQTQYT